MVSVKLMLKILLEKFQNVKKERLYVALYILTSDTYIWVRNCRRYFFISLFTVLDISTLLSIFSRDPQRAVSHHGKSADLRHLSAHLNSEDSCRSFLSGFVVFIFQLKTLLRQVKYIHCVTPSLKKGHSWRGYYCL